MDWKQIKSIAKDLSTNVRNSSSGWVRMNCPYCLHRINKADGRQSLAFYIPYGFFRCFRCGIKVLLKDWVARDVSEYDNTIYHQKKAPEWFSPLFGGPENSATYAQATAYAEGRGYDVALRRATNMGACATGDYNTRIIIPHTDEFGEWWGFTGRNWLGRCEEPYRYPTGMSRSRMFNEQALKLGVRDPAMLMEGTCDAILYWPDPVTCGGKPIEEQYETLFASNRPIAVILDGDAWAEGWRTAMRLRLHGKEAGAVRIAAGRDPNDRHYIDVFDVRRAALECITTLRPVIVEEKRVREQTYV